MTEKKQKNFETMYFWDYSCNNINNFKSTSQYKSIDHYSHSPYLTKNILTNYLLCACKNRDQLSKNSCKI